MITQYYTRCHLHGSKISLFAFRGHRILEFTGGRFHIDSWIMTEAPVCIFISIEIWAPVFLNCVTTNRELDGGPPPSFPAFQLQSATVHKHHTYIRNYLIFGVPPRFWSRFAGTVNYRSILLWISVIKGVAHMIWKYNSWLRSWTPTSFQGVKGQKQASVKHQPHPESV